MLSDQDRNLLIQAMTTEHFTLQTAHGISVSEAIGRTSHLWTAVTGSVVALAFIAQVSQLGDVFFLFALAVLPVLFFLGATTYVLLVQNSLLSAAYVMGVDRIRELYRQIAPPSGRFLLPQLSPDNWPIEGVSGQLFFTHATQAAILTSLIGGVLVAVVVARVWQASPGACGVVAVRVSLLVAVYLFGDQRRQRQRNRRLLSTVGHQKSRSRSPSPEFNLDFSESASGTSVMPISRAQACRCCAGPERWLPRLAV